MLPRRPEVSERWRHSGVTGRSAGGLLVLAALAAAAFVGWSGGLAAARVPGAADVARAVEAGSLAVGGDAAAGHDLFLTSCAACHGPSGEGTANAPNITQAGAALVDYVLRTGRMPRPDINGPSQRRQPLFDDAQIQAIVAYVASLGTGPAIPQVAVSGADLALGRSLFIENCAACHGAAGSGGAVGGGFVAPSLHQADPVTVGEAVTVGPGPMPEFRFTAAQLNAIAAYVQQLRNQPSPGGLAIAQVGPVPEGFVAGFVGLVALLVLVRWIGRKPAP